MNHEKQPPCTCGGISVEERMQTMSPCSYCDGDDAGAILYMFKALEDVKENSSIPANDFAHKFAKTLLSANA